MKIDDLLKIVHLYLDNYEQNEDPTFLRKVFKVILMMEKPALTYGRGNAHKKWL